MNEIETEQKSGNIAYRNLLHQVRKSTTSSSLKMKNSLQLKELYENTYKKRLEHRLMKTELIDMYTLKMNLFDMRFEVSKRIKSED